MKFGRNKKMRTAFVKVEKHWLRAIFASLNGNDTIHCLPLFGANKPRFTIGLKLERNLEDWTGADEGDVV